MRLSLLPLAVAAIACGRPVSTPVPVSSGASIARARALQERIITIDTHDDIPLNFASAEVDPLNADRQVNLEKMRAGGLDVAFFAVFVGQTPRTPENYARARTDAMAKFTAIHRMADSMYPDRIGLATSPERVRRIHDSGRLVAAIGIENGYVIGKDLSLVQTYFDLGARYMTLAHTQNNDICDSSTDPAGPEHNGLSAFGRQVVAEMNRVGMMVDISHVSKACMMQATAMSRFPVIASHSSTRALADVPRNLDDEQLLAIRKNGGVAQIVAFASYVKVDPPEKRAAIDTLRRAMGIAGGRGAFARLTDEQRAEYERRLGEIERRWPGPNVSDFVDHIDHAVQVAGIDHVGISSDFDGGGGVTGWRDASQTMNVTAELQRRGYTDAQIRKLWGENLLRVWGENQRLAGGAKPAMPAQVAGLSGTLVVTNKTPSTATIIDVASGRIVATLPTGAGPHEVALSRDGRTAVVTDYSGQPGRTLTVIDVPALRVARTIDLGQYNRPHGITFLPGDTLVAVTSEASGNVVVVNPHRGAIVKAVPTQARGSHMVAVTADGARAYTGNIASNSVSELDLANGRFVRAWDVPAAPEAINVTPDGSEVWVGSNTTGKVSVIHVASGAVTTVADSVLWPYRVLYTPDVRTAVIPDLRGETVRFLDRASKRELGRLAFTGAAPQGIAVTPDGRYVFESLSAQGRVAIIDVAKRAVVGYLAAGDTPDGVAYTTMTVRPGSN